MSKALKDFLDNVRSVTKEDIKQNKSIDVLFANTVEELGEYAAARTIEKGIKNKELKESSKIESVDLIICALSLFYASGGTQEQLHKIGKRKLKKWAKRVGL